MTVTVAANGGGYTGESTEVKVTVEDPDDPALVVSRSSLGLDENGSRTFTVKLATQPTGDVAVTVKSGDIGAVSAKPASLGFDPDNWDRARTVTVSGKDDADASHESTSVSLVASGGDYEGESAEVKVTIEDDDTKGVVVSPTPPEFLSVDEGGSRPFSVKLATEPTGDVTVSVSVSPLAAGEMTVNPASLTFKQANYGTWQTVWVSGDQDDDASDEKGGVKLSASGSDYGGQEAWVYVAVDDDDEAALVVSRTSLAVNEGSSGTYTVKLATEPTAAVTVTISGMAKGVTVDDSSLAFSTSNWDTAQTVTVSAAEDDNAASEEVTLINTPSGGGYGSVAAKSVVVTTEDDDTPALVVSPMSLEVGEGNSATYTVELATQPSGPVTVTVSGMAKGVSVDDSSLTFSTSNWGDAQTVTVSAAEDDNAASEEVTLTNTPSGGGYGSVAAKSVVVTTEDDDTPALVVSPASLEVAEGSSDTYTVKLATQPSSAVTVTISGMAKGVSVDDSSLTFSTSNWSNAQAVTVSAAEDDNAASEEVTLINTPSGGGYGSVAAKSVVVTTEDDDTPGLVLSRSSLSVGEGSSGTYTVRLATQPSGPVTVTVSGMAKGVSVDDSSLAFSTSNWSDAQTVAVSAAEDDNAASEEVTLTNTPSGGDYGSVAAKSVVVTTEDDDKPALVLSRSSLPVSEGASGTYTVKLATQPSGPVTVTVSGMAKGVSVDDSSLTFSTSNWSNAQTVTVSAAEDDNAASEEVTLTNAPSGGGYGSVAAKTVVVTTEDDDKPALVLSRSSLPVSEGASGTYTVKLATQPSGPVTVTVSGMASGVSVDDSSLTFSTSNWSNAQTVTVSAAEDDNAASEEVTLTNTPSGGGYGSVAAKSVVVTTEDDDKPALLVTPESLELVEGADGKGFTVKLATAPAEAVAVSVSVPDGDAGKVTVRPASLTFTADDYGSVQTVTVTGAQDDDAQDETAAVDLKASGGGYDGVSASVAVTVTDVASTSDDASFVSYVEVPSTMATGSSATVTVRMRNTGTTTWTSAAGYQLASQRPDDNATWGLSRVSLPSDVAPRATVDFTFQITAPDEAGGRTFRWRMVRGADGWFGRKAKLRQILVEEDESPSFGASTIAGQSWIKDAEVASLALPAAAGGNGDLAYALSGELPAGVTFEAAARTLSGTPVKEQKATEYTYTATDADGDAASLVFTIEVVGVSSDDASFVSYADVPSTMAAGSSATVTVRMRNAGMTTWTSAGGYALGSQRPDDNETWGLSRAPLPADVAPKETVDFTFEIKAPEEVGGHKFRWKMVRGADGWFGRKTALRDIAVTGPSFGDATIADQTWAKAAPIEALTLPEAIGAAGALTYALTPSLPDGMTFTESTRTLSGTPTELQAATKYTYTATDRGGDAAVLTFRVKVEEASTDDASFVSLSGVPSKMAAGGTVTVTVTMTNTGTTTWTPFGGYGLGSRSPENNDTWGLRRAPVSGSVAPNETVDFAFPITAPERTGSYAFAWRMVRDPGEWFGSGTGDVTITVEDPSFGDATIPDQTWVQDTALEASTLPAASGGDGGLTYALTPALPDGVSFDATTRVLSGTPTMPQATTEYAYTATDADGDAAEITFSITVEASQRNDAAFVSVSGLPSKMAAGGTVTVTVTMTNTGTTTWTPFGGYGLGSRSPENNDTWGLRRAPLSGSVAPAGTVDFTFPITAPETVGSYTFAWRMVRDPGEWFGAGTGDVTITVEDPSFGDARISDQTWVRGEALEALTLPAASGGDGALTYALTPAPPAGVGFDPTTRVLSGTPTTLQAAAAYAYTATDADGDAATLAFTITVSRPLASAQSSSTAFAPGAGLGDEDMGAAPAPTGVFDMFEYWLAPHGKAVAVRARLGDGRLAAAGGSLPVRSFWRGDLWGRKVALLGDPGGERYDIFEEVEDGLDYWGTYEGGAAGGTAGGEGRPSWSLDRPFRWMNRFMVVGDVVESRVTGRLLSGRTRNQAGVAETTMRLEVLSHRASFAIPAVEGPAFEDVLAVRFWPDAERPEAHDTFHLARGFGAVHWRRSGAAAPGEVVEWWAVEKALASVAPSAPSVPWFDPFSPGWPKTAVLNGNLEDFGNAANAASASNGLEGARVGSLASPGWTADSGDAVLGPTPSGLAGGAWSLRLRGSEGGGDGAADAVTTEEWIPVEGGTYQLSACMMRESAADNVTVDFDDGRGRDADFADAHLVAASTGTWECRAVTKCIPASVGAVRIRAARAGANLGDAWFDRVELKRIAACGERPGASRP